MFPQPLYCLNIYPGTSIEDVQKALFKQCLPVYKGVFPGQESYSAGIWLNNDVTCHLLDGDNLLRFKNRLEDGGLTTTTLNGFPFDVFHGRRIKELVYLPDWSSDERLTYTKRLGEILSVLLPEGESGSISTLPVGYATACSEKTVLRGAENMAECALHFHKLKEQHGKDICLAIEPEPDCVAGDVNSFIRFYNDVLLLNGTLLLSGKYGIGLECAETIIRRHVGICLDTVHSAVCGENPGMSLAILKQEGITVGKIQLGAALKAQGPDYSQLKSFSDPVYLHQTRFYHGKEVKSFADLPDFLADSNSLSFEGYALVHYHMPFTWQGDGTLSSYHDVTPSFLAKAVSTGVKCFELEIYTLSVFPEFNNAERYDQEQLISGVLIDELRWLVKKFDNVT